MSDTSLVFLDRAQQALALARAAGDLAGAHEIRDRAAAIQHYQRVIGAGLDRQNQAAEIKLRAERVMGQILREMPKNKGERGHFTGGTTMVPPVDTPTLSDLGIDKHLSSRTQSVAAVPEETFELYIAQRKDAGQEVTTVGLLSNRAYRGVLSSESNEWYTPSQYIEAARTVMGSIDLDPASSVMANETVCAVRFYDLDTDGLRQPWSGCVWLNPPYGGIQADFTERLVTEYAAGNVEAAVLLVSAHATDTDWFQPLFNQPLCFTNHRIKFDSPTHTSPANTGGSVFAYFGSHLQEFAAEFAQFGAVVARIK